MISQGGIDEWLLSFEGFDGAATGQSVFEDVSLDYFGKEFRDRSQPQSVPPIPSIQWFSQHKLSTVGVIAQVQPVIHLTPVFDAFGDRSSCGPCVDAADDNIHTRHFSLWIEPLRNSFPVESPEQIQPVGENHRFIQTDLRLAERLAYAVRWRDYVGVEQSDVDAFRVSVCQQCLMEVRQPSRNGASISAASHNQHALSVFQQFRMNMMCFHVFILHLVSRQTPEAFACCPPEASPEMSASALPGLTKGLESRLNGSSVGLRHWDE